MLAPCPLPFSTSISLPSRAAGTKARRAGGASVLRVTGGSGGGLPRSALPRAPVIALASAILAADLPLRPGQAAIRGGAGGRAGPLRGTATGAADAFVEVLGLRRLQGQRGLNERQDEQRGERTAFPVAHRPVLSIAPRLHSVAPGRSL